MSKREHRLRSGIRFSLFATSYTPLFLLMIIRQLSTNVVYLNWGGFNYQSLHNLIQFFGLSLLLCFIMLLGFFGLYIFIRRISASTKANGDIVTVKDVKNRNSEAISYIGTYIIPFLFQDYSFGFELLSVVILLVVIYFIYINSTLILINPMLNLKYSLYEVDFVDNHAAKELKEKSGLLITKEKFLEEGDNMLFKKIGHKLYFAINGGE